VVVGDTPAQAVDAATAIDVTYEQLPAAVGPSEAADDDAPVVHDEVDDNLAFDWEIGDEASTAEAFESAEYTASIDLTQQRIVPSAMEPRASLADYDSATGELTLWLTTQNPHLHRTLLATQTLGIPESKIRVIAPEVGGGFGNKIYHYPDEAIVSWCSMQLDRPVKWQATRSEDNHAACHSRAHETQGEIALAEDGTIVGIRADTYADMGAYLQFFAPAVPTFMYGCLFPGQYGIPNVHCRVRGRSRTRRRSTRTAGLAAQRPPSSSSDSSTSAPARLEWTPSNSDDRTTSSPRSSLRQRRRAHLRQRRLRALPRHGAREGRLRGTPRAPGGTPRGRPVSRHRHRRVRGGLRYRTVSDRRRTRLHDRALGEFGGPVQLLRDRNRLLWYVWPRTGTRDDVRTDRFGRTGGRLRGHRDRRGRHRPDPRGTGSYGSRSGPVGGSAVVSSSRKVVEKARQIAAHQLEVTPKDVEFEDGTFSIAGAPSRAVGIQEIAREAYTGFNLPDGMEPGLEATAFYDPENYTYPFGTHVAVVEVDPESGEVDVQRYVAVDDVGTQINPRVVEGRSTAASHRGNRTGALRGSGVRRDRESPHRLLRELRRAGRRPDTHHRDRFDRHAVPAQPARREGRR